MRSLYVKQKKMLRKAYKDILALGIEYPTVDDMGSVYWDVYNVHPFEDFDSHVENFFDSLNFERSLSSR